MPSNWRLTEGEMFITTFKCMFLHFQWLDAAYPSDTSCLGLVKKTVKKNRSRDVFRVKTFQYPGSYSVQHDPLECQLFFFNCKAILSLLLSLADLLSSELPFLLLWAFSPPPPPPPAASFGLTPFISVIRQIRGLRFMEELVQIFLGQQVCCWWSRSLITQWDWSITTLWLSPRLN